MYNNNDLRKKLILDLPFFNFNKEKEVEHFKEKYNGLFYFKSEECVATQSKIISVLFDFTRIGLDIKCMASKHITDVGLRELNSNRTALEDYFNRIHICFENMYFIDAVEHCVTNVVKEYIEKYMTIEELVVEYVRYIKNGKAWLKGDIESYFYRYFIKDNTTSLRDKVLHVYNLFRMELIRQEQDSYMTSCIITNFYRNSLEIKEKDISEIIGKHFSYFDIYNLTEDDFVMLELNGLISI